MKKYQNNFSKVEQKIIEVEKKDKIRNWKNPLTGQEIMTALQIPPSIVVGNIKNAVITWFVS